MANTAPGKIAGNVAVIAVDDHGDTADSTTISDANFAPANAVCCEGWKQVAVFVIFTGGTAPTVTIEPLLKAVPAAGVVGGSSWVRGAAKTAALTDRLMAIVDVNGRHFYPRVDARTGTPTSFDIMVIGWTPFEYEGPKQG
jgi:hypothetical protein